MKKSTQEQIKMKTAIELCKLATLCEKAVFSLLEWDLEKCSEARDVAIELSYPEFVDPKKKQKRRVMNR